MITSIKGEKIQEYENTAGPKATALYQKINSLSGQNFYEKVSRCGLFFFSNVSKTGYECKAGEIGEVLKSERDQLAISKNIMTNRLANIVDLQKMEKVMELVKQNFGEMDVEVIFHDEGDRVLIYNMVIKMIENGWFSKKYSVKTYLMY